MNHTRRSNCVPQSIQVCAGPPSTSAVHTTCCTCSASKKLCSVHLSWLQLQETLIEKEHSLSTLSDKISGLALHESESKRKDAVIEELRGDIAELQKDIQEKKARLSTLEDFLATSEHAVIKKEGKILMLSETIENIEKKLSLVNKTNIGLQSQLTEKTQMLAVKSDELKQLKKGKRFVEDGLNSSQDEMKEKKATLLSQNERIQRLRNSNDELKSKYEMKQQECSRLIETERNFHQEVARLKQKSNTVSEQLSNTQKHLTQTTSINDDLAVKVGQLQEQLDSMCHQLKSLVGLHTSTTPSSLTDANHIVSSVSQLVTEQLKMKQELNQYKMELNETMERYSTLEMDAESVKDCLATLKLPIADFVPMETMISGTCSMLEKLQLKTDCISTMNSILLTLVLQIKNMYSILHSVSSCTRKEYEESDGNCTDVTRAVSQICKEVQEYKTKCSRLEERLAITTDQHSSVMEQALTLVKIDNDKKMIDAVEEMRRKEKDNYNKLVATEKKKLETEKAKYMEKMNAKLNDAQKANQQLENLLQERDNEVTTLSAEIEALKESSKQYQSELEQLITKMEEIEKCNQETQLVTEVSSQIKEQELHQSILEYKVQGQEHARTIVELERKLLSSLQNSSNLTTANEGLKAKMTSLETQLEQSLRQLKEKTENVDGIINTLRRQLTLANEQSGKQRIEVIEIEESLRETEDIYKKKIAEFKRQHEKELIDLKQTLSNNEVTITKLNQQLAEANGQLKGQGEFTRQIRQENTALVEKLSGLATNNRDGRKETSMETTQFSSVGKRCLGEQHDKVISSQEHGIIELRKRVNELMKNSTPVPSHQAALKELIQLRQEVSHMRAEEVIRQEKEKHQKNNSSIEKDGAGSKERTNVSIHKLKDLEEALNQSEEAYTLLLETVCSKLLCPFPANTTGITQKFSGANKIARQHIMRDREEFVNGSLLKAIDGLKNEQDLYAAHQEEAGYTDYIKEETVQSPSAVDACTPPLTPDLTDCGVYPSKEIEDLDKQKRLYQAITKREEFKQSQQERVNQKPSTHSCLITPEDANHMVESVQKMNTDKLLRKDMEISNLKKDLQKSQQMTDTMASKIKLSSY